MTSTREQIPEILGRLKAGKVTGVISDMGHKALYTAMLSGLSGLDEERIARFMGGMMIESVFNESEIDRYKVWDAMLREAPFFPYLPKDWDNAMQSRDEIAEQALEVLHRYHSPDAVVFS